MAFFDLKPGLNRLEKIAILWTLKNSVCYSQKGFFFSCGKSLSIISSLMFTEST